tara:strand:+ start:19625 stop:20452 length:828 start_codon:yes stop_codon:yes gene_type:complete
MNNYLKQYPIIYYDLETTGFSSVTDDILEIAGLSSNSRKIFHEFVNTTIEIKNSHIHGITNDYLNTNVSLTTENIIDNFIKYVNGEIQNNSIMLIAHNNFHFDSKFIDVIFKKNNRTVPNNWIFLDSIDHIKYTVPGLPSYSLGNLYKRIFNTPLNNAHSALGDVKGLEKVYIECVEHNLIDTEYQSMIMSENQFMRISSFHCDFFKQSITLLDIHDYVLKILKKNNINTLDDLAYYYRDNDNFDNVIKNTMKISSKYYRNRIGFWGEYLNFMKL